MRFLPTLAVLLTIPASSPAADAKGPRAVVAWPSGPLDVCVAFDGPLDPSVTAGLVGASIPFGDPAARKDNAEAQGKAALRTLKVAAARLSDDQRTLILATDPHPFRASYRAILPGIRGAGEAGAGETVTITYGLTGVQTEFQPEGGGKATGPLWWPGLDLDTVRDLTKGSAEHERFARPLQSPGRLTVRTMVSFPKGKVTIRLRSSGTLEEPSLAGEVAEVKSSDGESRADLTTESTGDPVELAFDVKTVQTERFVLRATASTGSEKEDRPIPTDRLALLWAPASPPLAAPAPPLPAAMAGGDPKKGEAVFFSEQAKCSICHAVRGKGGAVGPDLTTLGPTDAATVYRDVLEPSATIHPEFVPYTVSTKDGQIFAGIVRAEGGDAIRVTGTDAKFTIVKRSEIEELRPSATSIMPVGLPGAIGEEKMRDLLAYLMGLTGKSGGEKK